MTQNDKLKHYPALFVWAILCMVPTLFYYYVGEEGVFTINTLEMWQSHEFTSITTYGNLQGRPPVFSWLMIPLSLILGWENILVASRIITVMATIGTGVIVAWLAHEIWRDKVVTWTTALLYLATADILLYRGWLSYADPLFSMFVVLSIALVWVACIRQNHALIWVSMFFAFAAFLTKAMTSYIFLGVGIFVLLFDKDHRRFLFGYRAWMAYAAGLLLPLVWLRYGTPEDGLGSMMSHDIAAKLKTPDLGAYVLRWFAYPSEMLVRLMPASLFIGYFLIRKRAAVLQQPALRFALLIALLNFLPYIIAPSGSVRYVLPVYAFVVMVAAYLVVQTGSPFKIKKWIVGMLVIGTLFNVLAFPYYQKAVRGENYMAMAHEILAKYGQYPLYATNYSTVGISIVANIDTLRLDQPTIKWPPADFKNGIVIAHDADEVPGQLLRDLNSDGIEAYLICRGAACGAAKD